MNYSMLFSYGEDKYHADFESVEKSEDFCINDDKMIWAIIVDNGGIVVGEYRYKKFSYRAYYRV